MRAELRPGHRRGRHDDRVGGAEEPSARPAAGHSRRPPAGCGRHPGTAADVAHHRLRERPGPEDRRGQLGGLQRRRLGDRGGPDGIGQDEGPGHEGDRHHDGGGDEPEPPGVGPGLGDGDADHWVSYRRTRSRTVSAVGSGQVADQHAVDEEDGTIGETDRPRVVAHHDHGLQRWHAPRRPAARGARSRPWCRGCRWARRRRPPLVAGPGPGPPPPAAAGRRRAPRGGGGCGHPARGCR